MATRESKDTSDLGEQAVALAGQLGHIVGTVEGTAGSWLDRQKLTSQLTRVRDAASQMLDKLSGGEGKARKAGSRQRNASAAAMRVDPAHAPGKRRRKPAPKGRGIKKANQSIPKMRTAKAARQRRKGFA